MKFVKLVMLIGVFVMSACHKDDNKPDPTPDPEPTPEPTPDPEPVPITCDGLPITAIRDVACPTGQTGAHKQVCSARGWVEVINTCAAPKPDEPVKPEPTCDGAPLTTIKILQCPQGQAGEHKQVCARDGWLDVSNTCKALPTGLKVELPNVYRINKGDKVGLGVKEQDGVTFQWSTGEITNVITAKPDTNKSYTVIGTRAADGVRAQATVSVLVQ